MRKATPRLEVIAAVAFAFFTLLNSFVFVSGLLQETNDFISRTMALLSLWIIFGLFPFGLGLFMLNQKRPGSKKVLSSVAFFIQTLTVLMVLGLLIVAR